MDRSGMAGYLFVRRRVDAVTGWGVSQGLLRRSRGLVTRCTGLSSSRCNGSIRDGRLLVRPASRRCRYRLGRVTGPFEAVEDQGEAELVLAAEVVAGLQHMPE